MLMGLIRPSGGSATVLGSTIDHPSRYAGAVGALIESPAFIPALSARRNLTSLALLRGLPLTRVDEVLDIVGLAGRDKEPVKSFSLGMKQRLVFAASLLHDPDVLVLDEPMVGLDPRSVRIVKDLLSARTREGMTVFMSTHTLAMAEEMADRVGIMVRGQLRFLGTIAELREQMSLESTTLEHLYLEVTSSRSRES